MKGSGPVFRKNSYNCLFFHCIRCCLPLSNDSLQLEKQGGRSGCRCDTAGYKIHKQIKHVEYFLHSWLHLLFDPIQCVSSSTWIHRTFCQISSNATLKQTIPWDLHRIKSLFVWLLLLSSIISTCSSPSLWCRRGTAEHLCDWGWMYGQRYAATVLNLMMAKGYSHTVSKLKKKKVFTLTWVYVQWNTSSLPLLTLPKHTEPPVVTTKATWGFGTSDLSHFVFCNHICLVRMISSMWVVFAPHCRSLPPHGSLTAFYLLHVYKCTYFKSRVICFVSHFLFHVSVWYQCSWALWRRSAFWCSSRYKEDRPR